MDTHSLLTRAGELGISSTLAHQALADGGREALARLIFATEPPRVPAESSPIFDDEEDDS